MKDEKQAGIKGSGIIDMLLYDPGVKLCGGRWSEGDELSYSRQVLLRTRVSKRQKTGRLNRGKQAGKTEGKARMKA